MNTDLLKNNFIKIGVLLIVALFVFETFAYQGANSGTTVTVTPTPTPTSRILAYADINANLTSYPDGVIIISGNGSASDASLKARLDSLAQSGKLAYYTTIGTDTINAVISNSANLTAIAWNLTDFNYSVIAKAQISLPDEINFTAGNATVSAPARLRAKMEIEPYIGVGASIPVHVSAFLVNGYIDESTGQPEVQIAISEARSLAFIQAAVANYSDSWIADASVPFSSRNINASELKARLDAKFCNSSVSYSASNLIAIPANISEEQKSLLNNLSYVNMVVGSNALIDSEFVNQNKLAADFGAILSNFTPAFPTSALEANLSCALNATELQNEIGNNATVSRMGNVSIGQAVQVGTANYFLRNGALITKLVPANASIGDAYSGIFVVGTKGGLVTSVQ